VTGNESWSFSRYDSDAMFARDRAGVVSRVSQTIGNKKVMIAIFFTGTRLMTLEWLPGGQQYNKDYLINTILDGVNTSYNQGRGQRVTKHTFIHMDNSKVHNGEETSIKI
jgi:hypothetical protein